MKGKLILEDGTIFEGKAFGYLGDSIGEVVFNTSMTGYQEVLTDPSYYGQIVTMTYPLVGNYGINLEDISAPRCFEIEERLRRELDIPVMHDDQWGAATVTLAALINSLKLAKIKKENLNRELFSLSSTGASFNNNLMEMRSAAAKTGLTLEEFNEKLKSQNNKCAICGNDETRDKHNVFAVDHCHKTGKVRGLLCHNCNYVLGGVKDNIMLLEQAIQYLKDNNATEHLL